MSSKTSPITRVAALALLLVGMGLTVSACAGGNATVATADARFANTSHTLSDSLAEQPELK